MSEMSREEAIARLQTSYLVDNNGDYGRLECLALNKAISDMQKLEKIEKRIADFQNGTDMFKGMDEAYVVFAIEDILKEV